VRLSSLGLDPLGRHAAFAPTILRAFAATFLIYMSQDNVVSGERMAEFERFLRQFGFPLVPLSARVSVYAQFAAGILFALGLFVRPAAAVMAFNFVVAIGMVHLGLPFREALDPSAMLATSLALLLTGGGALSLDGWLARRAGARRAAIAPADALHARGRAV
jgi:putative oxidoreductase